MVLANTGLWGVPVVSSVDLVAAEPVMEMCGAVGAVLYSGRYTGATRPDTVSQTDNSQGPNRRLRSILLIILQLKAAMMFQPVLLLVFLAPLLICCTATDKPMDCSDILQQKPKSRSGVYTVYPFGGAQVIQRRMDGSVNFYRDWDQYVQGFGDANGEYWFGLEFMHKITARGKHELLVEMEDFEGKKVSARYSSFSVGENCDGYKLTVSGFTDGGAGDSLSGHNNMKFTTFDKDQDVWENNCAKTFLGGFWYGACHHTNPNGIYRRGLDTTIHAIGMEWKTWKGHDYSLKSISFKIRPAK
ncbi:hypothetical protein WMY93_005870 [Mugilogobius chulae]|uniref:Fibrinogen C-terminal domain-containing protein n=1 Tax=Mugilogobius chulae TaxID=88201 RepID=A0AAW0PI03_9GOBI